MALIPTVVAGAIGVYLGLRWGGRPANVLDWRPQLWQVGLGGLTLWIVTDITSVSGSLAVVLRLLALGLLLGFAVLNIRTGGMVLVVAGVALNLIVTLLNWGMPVSAAALESAGLIANADDAATVQLSGGREVADGAFLGFLGDVIPLPWGQVISLGDLLWLAGLALVTASVMRRYEVRRPWSQRSGGSYTDTLSVLNRGPAPRRGPGLHPSRMGNKRPGGRPRA